MGEVSGMGDIERWTIYVPRPASSRAEPGIAYERSDRYAEGQDAVEVVRADLHRGAVALSAETAAVAATLVDLAKRNLPPHISESQQAEAYLALRRIAGGR